MKCPKCQGRPALKPVDLIGDVEVDFCEACEGMYFQKGEMGTYLHFSKDLPNYKDLLAKAAPSCDCPECGKKMKELAYVPGKDLLVDLCEACGGVWLDGGEAKQAKSIADAQDDRKLRLLRSIWEMRSQVRGTAPLRCPKCATPSVNPFSTSEQCTLDMCDRCNGCWFDAGEIAQYFELSKDVPDLDKALKSATPTKYACPKCKGATLVEFEYSAIELASGRLRVDYCRSCKGIWLDPGEVVSLECLATKLESPGSRLGRAIKELHDKGYVLVGMG